MHILPHHHSSPLVNYLISPSLPLFLWVLANILQLHILELYLDHVLWVKLWMSCLNGLLFMDPFTILYPDKYPHMTFCALIPLDANRVGFNHYGSLLKIVIGEFDRPRSILLHSSLQPFDPMLRLICCNPTNSLSCRSILDKNLSNFHLTDRQLSLDWIFSTCRATDRPLQLVHMLVLPLTTSRRHLVEHFLTTSCLQLILGLLYRLLHQFSSHLPLASSYFLWFFLHIALTLGTPYLI